MRLCFFGDVHGNLPALQAVLVAIAREQPSQVLCLGDLVGWGPQPLEVVRQVMALGLGGVFGNHEGLCLGHFADDPDQLDRIAVTRWQQAALAGRQVERTWLGNLPWMIHAGPATVCHDNPFTLPPVGRPLGAEAFGDLDVAGFDRWREALRRHERPLIVSGHDHLPQLYRVSTADESTDHLLPQPGDCFKLHQNDRLWVRAPSVGGPSRHGGWTGGYLVLDTDTARLSFVAVDYDREAAAAAYRAVPELMAVPTVAAWVAMLVGKGNHGNGRSSC